MRVMQHIQSVQRDTIAVSLISLSLVLPAFFAGGRSDLGLALFFFFLLLGIFVWPRDGYRISSGHTVPLAFAALFGGWMILHTAILSTAPYTAIISGLPIMGGVILFLFFSTSQLRPIHTNILFGFLIAAVTVLATWGLYIALAEIDFTLRFGSLFYQHNMYAGFLLLPLFLIIATLWRQPASWRSVVLFAAVLLFTSFIVTFSRGGFISFAAGLVVFCFLVFSQKYTPKTILKMVGILLFVLLLAGVAAAGIIGVKSVQSTTIADKNVGTPYDAEEPQKGESGLQARLQYWDQAWQLIQEQPVRGFGIGAFEFEARRVQEDIRYYSVGPHNIFLRLFAELGVVGVILFTAMLASVAYIVARSFWRRRPDIATSAVAAGLVSMVIHNAGDADFQFAANIALFFTAGGLLLQRTNTNLPQTPSTHDSTYLPQALLLGTAIMTIIATSVVLGNVAMDEAKRFYGQDERDIDGFYQYFDLATTLNPLNPLYYVEAAEVAFNQERFDDAQRYIERAHSIRPNDYVITLLYARIVKKQEDEALAITLYRNALETGAYRDLKAALGLAELLHSQGERQEASQIAKNAIERFPNTHMESHLWKNPNKPSVRIHRAVLHRYTKQ